MAAQDIGIKIAVEGEADFKRALKSITQQSKELSSEMKAVTSAFDKNDASQEKLAAQSAVLSKQIDTQKQKIELLQAQYAKAEAKLDTLGQALSEANQEYGENSKQAEKARKAYDNQANVLSQLRTNINNATTALNTMTRQQKELANEADDSKSAFDKLSREIDDQESELKSLKKAYSDLVVEQSDSTDEANELKGKISRLSTELAENKTRLKQAADAADELDESLDDAGDAADDAKGGLSGLADVIGGNAIVEGVKAIASAVAQLREQTLEYRKIMSSLEQSSQAAGYSAAETSETYKTLVGVLADSQQAATTTANLQALGIEQEELTDLTYAAIGAWATYGDSIPIDGLAESITETAKAGTVTGTFADVLNWASGSEDEFNEKLAACKDETERTNLILQEMADQGLIDVGKGWIESEESLVGYNQAQDDLTAATARLAEAAEPAMAAVTEGAANALNAAADLGEFTFSALIGDYDDLTERIKGLTDEQREQVTATLQQYEGSVISAEGMAALEAAIDEVTGASKLSEIQNMTLDESTRALVDTTAAEIEALGEQNTKYTEASDALYNLTTQHVETKETIQATISTIQTKMDELQAAYDETKASAENSLTSQYTLFTSLGDIVNQETGEINYTLAASAEEVKANLEYQTTLFNQYADNIAYAADRGVSQGLLERLSDGSIESASILAQMAAMSDEELKAFSDTFDQSENAKTNLATTFAEVSTSYTREMSVLQSKMDQAEQALEDENKLYGIGVSYVMGFVNGISDETDKEIPATLKKMTSLANNTTAEMLGVNSPSTITYEDGKYYVLGLRNGIQANQTIAANAAKALANVVNASLKNNLDVSAATTSGYTLANNLRLGIQTNQILPVTAAANMAKTVSAAAKNNIDAAALQSAGAAMDNNLRLGIQTNQITPVTAAANMAKTTTASASNNLGSLYNAGVNVARGLANGINSGAAIAINAAVSMAQRAINAAKSTLKISSPSKVFEEIGQYTGEGFAIGFTGYDVGNAINSSLNAAIAQAGALTAAGSMPISATLSGGAAGAGSTNIEIVVNAAEGQSAQAIANAVMRRMQHAVAQKQAVWG